jgi:nucleoside-diphosphate-sugar epimerase
MRVVIVGASGNVGTAILRRLRPEPDVDIVGVARRPPPPDAGTPYDSMDWHAIDVGADDAVDRLVPIFTGAAAVVHLAWQIQPSHDRQRLRRTNVDGSAHVTEAAVRARTPALVYASSVGTYAPGPKDRFVGEDWPATGVPGSSYSEDKAAVEALLDGVEREHPGLRVVRLRPGLIFQRVAGTEIARYFAGPLLPLPLLRFGRLPVVPSHPRLRLQAVHADDVADAYVGAVRGDAHGAFNLAAIPVLTPAVVAAAFHGRTVPVPASLLKTMAQLTWRARLQPVDAGWVELALAAPLLSTRRAESELGWRPRVDAVSALRELLAGMADDAGTASPPLSPDPARPGRTGALLRGRLPGQGDPY